MPPVQDWRGIARVGTREAEHKREARREMRSPPGTADLRGGPVAAVCDPAGHLL